MKHLKQLTFNLMLLSSSVVVATDSPITYEEDLLLLYQDEEMISIATGTEKPIHLAPSVASVITAREIKALGARTIDEALEFVPGLHISKDPSRQSTIYSIRGIHSDFNPQVILLLNGHPINEPITGTRPPLFKLPVANISRIEVIRGPGSAVYGADAFAGVINIITKDTSEIDGTIAGIRAGSFNSKDVWLQHGGELGGWKSAFSFEYSTTDGDNSRIIDSDLQTILDSLPSSGSPISTAPSAMSTHYELYNTSLNLEKGNWNLWLNSWNQRNAGVGVGVTQILDPIGTQEADQYIVKLDYDNKNFTENWQLTSNLTYRKLDQQAIFQLFPANAAAVLDKDGNFFLPHTPITDFGGYAQFTEGAYGNPGGEIDHTSFETAFSYHGIKNHLMRFALGIKHDNVVGKETKNFGPGVIDGTTLSTIPTAPTPIDGTLTSVTNTDDIFMPESTRTVYHISFQDEWKFAYDWELTGGVRYDHYSDFGNTINPRLALVWATRYNLTSKLLYGRAFRAPSFTELYFINNPAALGNTDLKPESIDMVELVFDYRPTFDLETVLNLYKYRADDLIALDSTKTSQNLHNQSGYGMEFDFSLRATKKITLLGNFAWQRSKDRNTNESVANAPGHQTSLAIRLRASDSCNFNTQLNRVSDRQRLSDDNMREKVDNYTTIDITTRCNNILEKPLEVAISVRNILDEDIREPSSYNADFGTAGVANDYPQESRSIYLEMIYNFNQ